MSAIAGIFRFDGQGADPEALNRVAAALRQYGPDQSNVVMNGSVGLVNVLMRMTPEDRFDAQPYHGERGAIITADLCLDNRDSLLLKLQIDSEEAATWPDSRVLLTAWERFGDEIWPAIRGPFAAAIWDPFRSRLILVRDHLGINVMVWHKNERFFAFSSMPKGLFALGDISRQLNEEKFADFLVLNHSDLENTIYKSVYRVMPSQMLIIQPNGVIEERRYWSPDSVAGVRFSSDEDYAIGLREHLQLAVRRQLRSIHPIACLLSGGLDSSSVATLAARALGDKGERLAAFTHVPRPGFSGVVPNGCYSDETSFVDSIARMSGNIDVTYVHSFNRDDFGDLERVFELIDGPVRNPINLGWMLETREQAGASGRRVILGARHGNFTISWDGWSQAADNLRHGRLVKAFAQWLLLYRTTSLSRWGAFRKLLLDPLLPTRALGRTMRNYKKQPPPAWRKDSPIKPALGMALGVDGRASAVDHDFYYRWKPGNRKGASTLADFEGDWIQAGKAMAGVEMRDPTTDVDVVSYCLAVPDEQYLAEGIDRSLIRRAMWGLLPECVLTNRLRGIQAVDWHEKLSRRREGIANEIAELAHSQLASRFIDFDRLDRALRNWPKGGWHRPEISSEYRFVLPRGLAAARFLAWFEHQEGSEYNQTPR